MKEHWDAFSIALLCQVMEVSVSSYYAWRKRPKSERKEKNQQIVEKIKDIHKQSRQTDGSPRMYVELKKQNISCSENRVARLMKLHQIAAKRKRRFVVTTDAKHDLPVAENILNQNFQATKSDEKWVTDITYIWTKEGWLYLAVVLDLFSRKMVGWAMDANRERWLAINALKMALPSRHPPKELLHHSDRGSQYASNDYQQVLNEL